MGLGRGGTCCIANKLPGEADTADTENHQAKKSTWAEFRYVRSSLEKRTCPSASPCAEPCSPQRGFLCLPPFHLHTCSLHHPGFSSSFKVGTVTVSNKQQKLVQSPRLKKVTSQKARRGRDMAAPGTVTAFWVAFLGGGLQHPHLKAGSTAWRPCSVS